MAKTRRTKLTKVRLWRWRSNPLRRRSDTVEAWIVLATWILALLGGLLAGQVAAVAMEDTLASRRAALHPVSATLIEEATEDSPPADSGASGDTVWAKVRWTTGDATHTGRARVEPPTAAGSRVTVWTDRTGALVSTPPTEAEARSQSAVTGGFAALSAVGTVLVCGRLGRRWLDQRRMAEWAAEWERVGPQWRKRMLG
ncbi:hypothetical protein OG453_41235 [Streptomyces sp. NBC_01381]|uniref:Rv1733c family protein n=1 Tax=Streptomyces sp. NBC_01381 TaxID=2903845 RepID=UPI0022552B55|nr:hypothetical protein [Streptomyces sp. NBC_01381]MCX4672993.1 hypothetical protein [Streptomyces sp. NBC_01381]